MRPTNFEQEIRKNLELLTQTQQEMALEYIKSLLNKTSTKEGMLQFAGSLDSASVEEMAKAIESGCEKIDSREW